ncbi:MAG TPA: choice-of-anchor U domain-containing protein [Candidatus Saccharimonadales bacterium]|nr:choice-of-anchor U domain-containing protein [Candidatus Saccharimonadales bacterium]
MALKQRLGRLVAVTGTFSLLFNFAMTPVVSAATGWSQFVKTSTNAQDGQQWYDTAASFTGQYQAVVAIGGDILESTNYGQTWTNVTDATPLSGKSWEGVGMSTDGKYQVAAENSGDLYVSSNFGQTWVNRTQSTPASGGSFYGAAVSSTGQYMAAVAGGGDIFVSSNYGQTWVNETTSTPASGKVWNDVTMSADGKHMVAVTDSDGVYTSSDFGHTWTNRAPSGPLSSAYMWTVTMSASGQTVYAPIYDGDIYKSTNYGQTWTDISNGTPDLSSAQVYFISTSADGMNVAFAAYSGDVYVSNNGGQSWTNMTTGTSLSNQGFYPLAMSGSGEYITSDIYQEGIYESKNTALAAKESANVSNGANGAMITISTPAGTTITCNTAQTETGQAAQDSNYSYPLGLLKLCYNTINGSDKVSITFVTDLKTTDVTARDYNTATGKWITIPGAVITDTTVNGHHALLLTYTITDNGSLDSNPALGVVSDPVGLAQTAGAPNTGYGKPTSSTPIQILGASSLVIFGIGVTQRTRKQTNQK